MSFNALCTGNDMMFACERIRTKEKKVKPIAPKSSYEIILKSKKKNNNPHNFTKIDFKPTKEAIFSEKNIPKSMIDFTFYSITNTNKKQIIALHIINKCLISKNPILSDSNLILYCHENETDLLRIAPFLIDISFQMKCDIVSFDYSGFGCSSGKPNINSIINDGEDVLKFVISELNYKIENIILLGKGIGTMGTIFLASQHTYNNCKALILCMPLILTNTIELKFLRSIFCPTLLIKEFEDKSEIAGDEIVNLCREIPNEKEWLPIRKRNKETKKNRLFFDPNSENDDYEDVYSRHRSKFIIKIRDYIYPDKEIMARKKNKSSTGDSTDSDTNITVPEEDPQMTMERVVRNNNIININFDDCNKKIKNQIVDNKNIKKELYDENEIEINNDEDY